MIISSTLQQFPVPALKDEQLLEGHRLIDLYRTIERLIERYQALFDELLEILPQKPGERRRAQLASTNRKLVGIAADMREIAGHLDGLLARESALRERLGDVLELCVQISKTESLGLVLDVGAPPDLDRGAKPPPLSVPDSIKAPRWSQSLGRLLPRRRGPELEDLTRVRAELDDYQRQLRSAVARARTGGSR